jgi:hypothetical protein
LFLQPFGFLCGRELELLDLDRGRSLGALFNFEADTVTFLEAFEAGTLDGTMVNEDIFAAIL